MSFLFFLIAPYFLGFKPIIQVSVMIGPLVAINYLSRRFEYSADRDAIEATGDPETAVRALANMHKVQEVPARSDRFIEFFMTHPALACRAEAIAKFGQIPNKRLSDILQDAGFPEATRHR